jgi:hypothetical protein
MIFPPKTIPFRLHLLFLLLSCLLGLMPAASLHAASLSAPAAKVSDVTVLPPALGEVVYQKNAASPFQVYIVVNSHRSCATGANGAVTVQAQAETFRIGEWLIRKKKVDLLLPEGFFGREKGVRIADGEEHRLDSEALGEKLSDTTTFVNADLLLHQIYGIGLHQVEDPELYSHTRKFLRAGLEDAAWLSPCYNEKLQYLQARRLAAILQNTPTAIETEFRQGSIASRNAMLTIGMAHLADIIKYLDAGEIRIPAPPGGVGGFQPFSGELELLKKKIGVTVIVPRVLIQSGKRLRMASL